MKNIVLIFGLLLSPVLMSSSFASHRKTVKSIQKTNLNFDVAGFTHYLNNGNPQKLEGVYSTKDKRYVIAIVKNSEKEHDYIGVILNSANKNIKTGDVRFNFVMDSEKNLVGNYYDNNGNSVEVVFNMEDMELGHIPMQKVGITQLQINLLS